MSVTIEAGTVPGTRRVWIGMPAERYDEVKGVFGRTRHILQFTPKEAEAAIEMLQTELDRVRTPRSDQPRDRARGADPSTESQTTN